MKTEISEVRHKGQVVGTVDVPIYDTVEEILQHNSEAHIVDMFNKQNKIAIQAKLRNKHTEGRMSKKVLREKAWNLLTTDEIARFAGNFEALQEFLDSDEMQKRVADSESGE